MRDTRNWKGYSSIQLKKVNMKYTKKRKENIKVQRRGYTEKSWGGKGNWRAICLLLAT